MWDTIDTDTVYVESVPSCSISGNLAVWNLPMIIEGGAENLTLVVVYTGAGPDPATNSAGASSDEYEEVQSSLISIGFGEAFTPMHTYTITNTITQTVTLTSTETITVSATPTATETEVPSLTNTKTVTSTITPTITLTGTPANTGTITQTVSPTVTETGTATDTPTMTDTPTSSNTPSPSGTATDIYTYTVTPSYTGTPTLTETPSYTFTETPSGTFTETSTPSETHTKTYTAAISPAPTISHTWTTSPTPDIDVALDRNYVDVRKGEAVNIGVKADVGINVEVKVYNLTGEFLRRFEFVTWNNGWNNIDWDVKNEAGNYVGRGIYFIHIKREDTGAVVRRVYVVK